MFFFFFFFLFIGFINFHKIQIGFFYLEKEKMKKLELARLGIGRGELNGFGDLLKLAWWGLI